MTAVSAAARRRLSSRWRGLVSAGILLGLGFGICLATLAAARTTASAYDRILAAADAPDAAVAHGLPLAEAVESLQAIPQITAQRVYAGFRGVADGIDPALTTGLIAPAQETFPLDLPVMSAGRLPDPDRSDEVFINETAARAADLEVGQRLRFRFFLPGTSRSAETTVTLVGIGTLPVEAVRDETMALGVVVFSHAFYESHADLVAYSVSNVELAPGFDARRDLAPAVRELGHDLQSARTREVQSINDALRPLLIVLVALGLLAFGATAVAAGQVLQRNAEHTRAESTTLRTLGMVRPQVLAVELITATVIAVLAVGTALTTLLLTSPIAPVGPLHRLDPEQGTSMELVVAALGSVAIVLTIAVFTVLTSSVRRRPSGSTPRSLRLASAARGPAALAGVTLALRAGRGRMRSWRPVAATTVATALVVLSATFVHSAAALAGTPARYGFDADLVALNAYGDQSPTALAETLGGRDDVVAATGFTLVPLLLEGRAVPGLAATSVKGEVTPTILQGRPALAGDEIVVGRETLDSVDAALGDVVQVQLSSRSTRDGEVVGDPRGLRIVGVATFPPISQIGTDMPRLGVGALVTREAFLRLGGDRSNHPEFTAIRMAEGTDPERLTARLTGGFEDPGRTTTTWFTGTKPAEIRQLDAAMPYLRGALLVGYVVLLVVAVHALWACTRANRHDLAVLRAVGSTSRQLNAVTAWQALPVALAAVLVGSPVGIALGRWAYRTFADSLAVVDATATTVVTVGAIVIGILAAIAVADVVAVLAARRIRAAVSLREA